MHKDHGRKTSIFGFADDMNLSDSTKEKCCLELFLFSIQIWLIGQTQKKTHPDKTMHHHQEHNIYNQ